MTPGSAGSGIVPGGAQPVPKGAGLRRTKLPQRRQPRAHRLLEFRFECFNLKNGR